MGRTPLEMTNSLPLNMVILYLKIGDVLIVYNINIPHLVR